MKFLTEHRMYDKIGGEETIQKLVDSFYPKVYNDPLLSPLFEGDINEIKRKQRMFLTQFLGGPALYSNEFGPPAMKQRHLPFKITPERAERWLFNMNNAMDDIGLTGDERDLFFERLKQVATIMVNTPSAPNS